MAEYRRVPVEGNPFEGLDRPLMTPGAAAMGILPPSGPEMRPYVPTLRDRLAAWMMGNAPSTGRTKAVEGLMGSRGTGTTGMGLVDLTPAAVPLAYDEAAPGQGAVAMGMAMAPPLKAAKPAVAGIRAFHGSPHSFDRFSMDKIGTGEGAQAYGHGLYFAENEGVARSYKEALTKQKAYDPATWQNANLPEYLSQTEQTRHIQLGDKMRQNGNLPKEEMQEWKELQNKRQTYYDAVEAAKPKGQMYEVRINANPEHFLDWDKPLSQQSPAVQEAMAKFGFKTDKKGLAAFDDALLEALATNAPTKPLPKQPPDPSGDALYRKVGEQTARTAGAYDKYRGFTQNPQAMGTAALAEAGIPGIRYLDQGSRGKGEGSSNFVVFNDKLIEILRKYGIAGLAALPPAIQEMARARLTPVEGNPFEKNSH